MNNDQLKIFLFVCMCIFITSVSDLKAQNVDTCLHSPLDVPLLMSSSFCEPRPGHFHSGVDYKTESRCGVKLFSIKAGELYRIKISPSGYGLALYIKHYDSTISVYAHMQSFREDIQKYARELQYAAQESRLDTIIENSPFRFKCGELIGYSGNTGHSFGPHLHFEIRKYPSNAALNSQNYFPVKDGISPDFYSVFLYDLDRNYLAESERVKRFSVSGRGKKYKRGIISVVPGKYGLGIEVKDRMTGTRHRYGVIDVKVYDNQELIYHSNIDEYKWEEANLSEVWFDEYYMRRIGRYVQRCFAEGVNRSKMVKSLPKDGVLTINSGDKHLIRIVATDGAGNESECMFKVIGTNSKKNIEDKKLYFSDKASFIVGDGYHLEIPKNSMYRDASISIDVSPDKNGNRVWKFADEFFVFYNPFKLSVDGSEIEYEKRDKTLLMRIQNGVKKPLFGQWNGLYYSVETRVPGKFFLACDTVAPSLSRGYRDSTYLTNRKSITYYSSDRMSGIKDYDAYIDGKWVMLEHEPRKARFKYKFDKRISRRKWHTWKIRIEDYVGNVSEDEFTFYY